MDEELEELPLTPVEIVDNAEPLVTDTFEDFDFSLLEKDDTPTEVYTLIDVTPE